MNEQPMDTIIAELEFWAAAHSPVGMVQALYPPSKWRRVEVEMSKASASSSGKAKRATEVLLISDGASK